MYKRQDVSIVLFVSVCCLFGVDCILCIKDYVVKHHFITKLLASVAPVVHIPGHTHGLEYSYVATKC